MQDEDSGRKPNPWESGDGADGCGPPLLPRSEPVFNPAAFEAWPVMLLLGMFIGLHAYAVLGGVRVDMNLLNEFAFFSGRFWRGEALHGLVSYAFLHGSWLHLGMNGVAFFVLGSLCWRMMGTGGFLLFFVATAIAGAIAFAAVRPLDGPLVGASGAIFGLLAAVKRVEFRRRARRGQDVRRETIKFLLQMVGLNALLGLATFNLMAWEAHLGGMALGWVMTPWMVRGEWSDG